jgi:hypothetical protein
MNPLLYKAHPLLYLTVDLLADPAAHSLKDAAWLALIYLAVNLFLAPCLWWGSRKAVGFAPSYLLTYFLALAAVVCYLAPMLTLLSDVLAHEFRFADRFILVFCLFVAMQMLGALYAVAIRYPRNGRAIGLRDGFSLSILMWLMTLPLGLAFLGLNSVLRIV